MSKIILAIKPKYSHAIFNNTKIFELRRVIPKQEIKVVFIYETAPSSQIVGKFYVNRHHIMKIEKLWELTKKNNMISKKHFFAYFKNKKKGFAYEITSPKKFKKPFDISKYNLKYPPQSFVYIK